MHTSSLNNAWLKYDGQLSPLNISMHRNLSTYTRVRTCPELETHQVYHLQSLNQMKPGY